MLRILLERVSNGLTPQENIDQVLLLAQSHAHSIVSLASHHPLKSYTCLVHALGFTGQSAYLDVAGMPPYSVFAGANFADWLLCSGVLEEVSVANAEVGDLVWYFKSDGFFKHVGLWRGTGRVESKWGDLGLFEHALLEIPESYGTAVRIFRALPYDVAIDLFYDFAEENGIPFEDTAS